MSSYLAGKPVTTHTAFSGSRKKKRREIYLSAKLLKKLTVQKVNKILSRLFIYVAIKKHIIECNADDTYEGKIRTCMFFK